MSANLTKHTTFWIIQYKLEVYKGVTNLNEK